MLAVVPLDLVVLGLEAGRRIALGQSRMVGQDLGVEVAPDQLAEPGGRAGVAVRRSPVRGARQLADRDGAEAQVHAQVARPAHCREVARVLVAVDALQEVVEERGAAADAGRDFQRRQVGPLEAQLGQRRHRLAVRRRHQRIGVAADRIGLQVEGVLDLGQPGPLVGREDAVGLAGLGEQLVALEDGVVLVAVEGHARVGQRTEHLRVAVERGRFVVAVGEHRLHVEAARELRDLVLGHGVAHDQAAAERMQGGVQLDQRLADEFDPAIDARQRIEDRAVEDEDADHLPARAQRVEERRVVVDAQVAPEPHQSLRVDLVDGQ